MNQKNKFRLLVALVTGRLTGSSKKIKFLKFDTERFLEIFSEQIFSCIKKPRKPLLHSSLVTSGQND